LLLYLRKSKGGVMVSSTPMALLGVTPRFVTWRGHRIALHEAGSGATVVLVHSINAAASAHEMRNPFRMLAETHRVVAIDLLGFGDSDRPKMPYTADVYTALLCDIIRDLATPVTIIAVSLSSAYVLAAAAQEPALFRQITVVCPTGLEDLVEPAPAGVAYQVLASPLGAAVFQTLVSRRSMDYFLGSMTYANPDACDRVMRDMYYRTGHQPGARWAPICFVSGMLNCDLRPLIRQITLPVQVIWGRYAKTTPVIRMSVFTSALPHAQGTVLDAGMAVQDEAPEQFITAVRQFWRNNETD
jgi:pimeloyl-ACP methyl ester carboxylesterase